MRALLAFDKFKDSLSAPDACAIAAAALRGARPTWTIDACPLADGGEGFAEILTVAARGELKRTEVMGPRDQSVSAQYGIVRAAEIPAAAREQLQVGPNGTIAVIEMAASSGLALLAPEERDVWRTSTIGTGQLLRAAAAEKVDAIVLGVGGSATSDLGVGALTALGLEVHPASDATPAGWAEVAAIGGGLVSLPPLFIACDVTNPLLGPRGAAAVYGPQKGLQREDVARFDHAAARMALMLCAHFNAPDAAMDQPGAGAAGGIAFGLMVAAKARLLPGFDFVSAWLDLGPRIQAADIVLTGEGRFDDTSLSGKGPGAIASRALALRKPAHVFAGAVAIGAPVPGLHAHAITPAGVPLAQALRDGADNLGRAVAEEFRPHNGGA